MITLMNCILAPLVALKYREYEMVESFQSNKLLEEREENMKDILNLFPSGILFYDNQKGVTYKNEYFNQVCKEVQTKQVSPFQKKSKFDMFRNINQSQHRFQSNPVIPELNDTSNIHEVLKKFKNKDQESKTLSDNLNSICNSG